ncbi:protein D1 isoform X2 [Bemisia tabaci]|uniref:protein D1 isoform X2 n=1 Tax=Bemisia tabaci TaxID=7038 RepID=UPI003B28A51B
MEPITIILQLCYITKFMVVARKVLEEKIKSVGGVEHAMPIAPFSMPPEEIEWRLKDDDVIPDVLPRSPTYPINVSYGPGIRANFGNDLEPDEVKKAPMRVAWPIIRGRNYTLILTGIHRYVFTVYEQPDVKPEWREPIIHKYDDKHRLNFSNQKFAKKYNLGDAYAANYFTSQHIPPDDDGPGVSAYDKGILKPDFGWGRT